MDTLTRTDAPEESTPRVAMDPRIRERRIKVRRDEGRRRLRILVAAASVALVVAAAVASAHSALLDVDHVRVQGTEKASRHDVVHAAGLDRKRYMVSVDPGATARRIESLPWVDTAHVTREWPGTVRIVVAERTPVAAVSVAGGQFALVDGSARVLDTVPSAPAGLLRIEGAASPPPPGQRITGAAAVPVTVAAVLPDNVRARVVSVTMTPAGGAELRLSGTSAVVRLGGADELDAKMVALSTLLTRADTRDLATIDVTVPTAPVLTRA